MAEIAKPIKRPSRNSGFGGRREAAPVVVTRKRKSSAQRVASVRVELMELRPGMCRWPIGDPQHSGTFRFCGSACSLDSAYCKSHDAIAHRSAKFKMARPVSTAWRL
jgi:GcrA cell cycle regulator